MASEKFVYKMYGIDEVGFYNKFPHYILDDEVRELVRDASNSDMIELINVIKTHLKKTTRKQKTKGSAISKL